MNVHVYGSVGGLRWGGGVGRDCGVYSRLGSRKENYSYPGKKVVKVQHRTDLILK